MAAILELIGDLLFSFIIEFAIVNLRFLGSTDRTGRRILVRSFVILWTGATAIVAVLVLAPGLWKLLAFILAGIASFLSRRMRKKHGAAADSA